MNCYDMPDSTKELDDVTEFIGKVIKSITMVDEEQLVFVFEDGKAFKLILDSDCCANVYFSTPDKLDALNGETFRGLNQIKLPDDDAADYGDIKEAAILEIQSNKDSIVIYHYNEHNGYYAGTSYSLFRMDDVVKPPVSPHAEQVRGTGEFKHISEPFKGLVKELQDAMEATNPIIAMRKVRPVTFEDLEAMLIAAWNALGLKDQSGT